MDEVKEAVFYFKNRPVYEKLFRAFREKYESLGYLGGGVVLKNLNIEEKLTLRDFLGKDVSKESTVRVTVKMMEKAISGSRFSGADLFWVLTEYFEETLQTKKEKKKKRQDEAEAFYEAAIEKTEDPRVRDWLLSVFYENGEGSILIKRVMKQNEKEAYHLLSSLIKGAESLPALSGRKKELLAVFAARVTGDPHFFDNGTTGQALLLAFIKYLYPDFENLGRSAAEGRYDLLFKGGIIKDALSSDVLVYGLRGRTSAGSLHEGMEGFFKGKEPMKLTALTLGNLKKVFVKENEDGEVYIVENPSVFSVLSSRYPNRAFICGSGQLRRAVFMLLDLLSENHIFYYAGDLDPEGLSIADKLKSRYGDKLRFWKYGEELYLKYLSAVEISEKSLRSLDGIRAKELSSPAALMREKRRAAYQEAMIMEMEITDESGENGS